MSAQSPRAFLLSAGLHGAIAALIIFFTWSANRKLSEQPRLVQLVQGEGDNFMATEAPLLGTPGGVKVDLPPLKLPEPEAAQPEPPAPAPEVVKMTPAPPQPAPAPVPLQKAPEKAAPKATPPATPNLAKQIQRSVIRAEANAKKQVAKERAAEAKREAEEKKKLTKAEFDAQNKAKTTTTTTKVASAKVTKVDTEGIVQGVKNGSSANKTGGARGSALTADQGAALERYISYFKQRLRALFEAPPGLSDTLQAGIEFRNNADGTISNMRITKSSGSPEFDQAVLAALRKVSLPERPDRKAEIIAFTFSMRDEEGR